MIGIGIWKITTQSKDSVLDVNRIVLGLLKKWTVKINEPGPENIPLAEKSQILLP